jgi:hypothetical protein
MGTTHDRLTKPLRIYKMPTARDPLPFSEAAEATLERSWEIYREKLIAYSRARAASQELDTVSRENVDQAIQYLRGHGQHPKKYLLVIGGTLAGAGLSGLLSLITNAANFDFARGSVSLILLTLALLLFSMGHEPDTEESEDASVPGLPTTCVRTRQRDAIQIEAEIDQIYDQLRVLVARAANDPETQSEIQHKRQHLRALKVEEAEILRRRAESMLQLDPGEGDRLLRHAEELLSR